MDMHRIGYLLSDGFQVMAIATQSVFECANLVSGSPFYAMETYSVDGGEVRSSSDERYVVPCLGQPGAEITAETAGGHNCNLHASFAAFLRRNRFPAPKSIVAFRRGKARIVQSERSKGQRSDRRSGGAVAVCAP